jgi:hypothetical protein
LTWAAPREHRQGGHPLTRVKLPGFRCQLERYCLAHVR